MSDLIYKKLHGDDDGGIYFMDKDGGVWYLNAFPELMKKIIALCETFFEELKRKNQGL